MKKQQIQAEINETKSIKMKINEIKIVIFNY